MPSDGRNMVAGKPGRHAAADHLLMCGLVLAMVLPPGSALLAAPNPAYMHQPDAPAAATGAPPAAPRAEVAAPTGDPPMLTIATWGGAYEQAQRAALFEPFTARTGIEIRVAQYDGGLTELRAQHADGEVTWDVVDMTMSDTLTACREGLLRPLPHDDLPPSPDGTPARRDFIAGALTRCGIAHTAYATVIAYDRRAFPGIRPDRVADLFDLERFPGRRALQQAPFGNLEWALHAYGVPTADIYRLLSTRRGLRLALARLADIAEQVVWWQDGATPARLLEQGDVVMATGYNGRFFAAMADRGAPIEILWDGQIQELENWAVTAGSRHLDAAKRFIRWATSTDALTRFARHLPYGPTRRSASRRVSGHIGTGIDMQPHLPTHPFNDRNTIVKDVEWYAWTHDRIRRLFRSWLTEYALGDPALSGGLRLKP
ncbi:ABC transporter substrate-binding protein [Thiohalocapsa halophila]|nr:ABC transporter substrate-binding protein [Thiohalocapsa halophila]